MKTVEVLKDDVVFQCTKGDVHRTSDTDAQAMVDAGSARYVPKSRWKAFRDADIERQRQQGVVGVITNQGTSFMPDGSKSTIHKETKSQRIQRERKERRKKHDNSENK